MNLVERLRYVAAFEDLPELRTEEEMLCALAADRIAALEAALRYALVYVGAWSLTKEQSDRLYELVKAAGMEDE